MVPAINRTPSTFHIAPSFVQGTLKNLRSPRCVLNKFERLNARFALEEYEQGQLSAESLVEELYGMLHTSHVRGIKRFGAKVYSAPLRKEIITQDEKTEWYGKLQDTLSDEEQSIMVIETSPLANYLSMFSRGFPRLFIASTLATGMAFALGIPAIVPPTLLVTSVIIFMFNLIIGKAYNDITEQIKIYLAHYQGMTRNSYQDNSSPRIVHRLLHPKLMLKILKWEAECSGLGLAVAPKLTERRQVRQDLEQRRRPFALPVTSLNIHGAWNIDPKLVADHDAFHLFACTNDSHQFTSSDEQFSLYLFLYDVFDNMRLPKSSKARMADHLIDMYENGLLFERHADKLDNFMRHAISIGRLITESYNFSLYKERFRRSLEELKDRHPLGQALLEAFDYQIKFFKTTNTDLFIAWFS